jgi:hypothetical protein
VIPGGIGPQASSAHGEILDSIVDEERHIADERLFVFTDTDAFDYAEKLSRPKLDPDDARRF